MKLLILNIVKYSIGLPYLIIGSIIFLSVGFIVTITEGEVHIFDGFLDDIKEIWKPMR